MLQKLTCFAVALASVVAVGFFPYVTGQAAQSRESGQTAGTGELPPYLQCVPYARQLSGVQLYGDAHTWWTQAAGKYQRGNQPKVGAVMAFEPHRNMRLGHVAAVSRILDARTVLLSHSNWSPIDGRRGQIERNVRAIDVSPNNDWSEVRVWYHPIQKLGTTVWPVQGFIYNKRGDGRGEITPTRVAQVVVTPARPVVARSESSKAFLGAFSEVKRPAKPSAIVSQPIAQKRQSPGRVVALAPDRTGDPVTRALAKYD